MRSPQVSRSLSRSETIINVCFLGRDAIDSSMISPLTHTEGAAEHLSASVRDHDVHDENGNELARTRRLHSPGTSYDHPGLAGRTCEAVRRRRGRACVAPRPQRLSGRADLTRSGHSVSVCGWYYARDGFYPSLRTTCGIVHARMAPCGRRSLPKGWVPGPR